MSGDTVEGGSSIALLASRWTVALCALIGLAVGLILFSLQTPIYESETILNVNNPIGTMADERALLLSNDVVGPAYRILGYDADIDVEPNEVADLLTITARADDPERAARAATVIAETYDQVQTSVPVSVTKVAEPNRSPVAPNRIAYILFGSALGAIAGLALGWIRALGRLAPNSAPQRDAATPIRPPRSPSPELAAAAAALRDVDVVHASVPANAALAANPAPAAIPEPLADEDYSAAALAQRWDPDSAFDADPIGSEPLSTPVFSPLAADAPPAPPAPAPATPAVAASPAIAAVPVVAVAPAIAAQFANTGTEEPLEPSVPEPAVAPAATASAFSAAANAMVEAPPLATSAWAPSQLELDASVAASIPEPPTPPPAPEPQAPELPAAHPPAAQPPAAELPRPALPAGAELSAVADAAELPGAAETPDAPERERALQNQIDLTDSATAPTGYVPVSAAAVDPVPRPPAPARAVGASARGEHRVGDLEAQVGALEQEIDSLREHLDNARVSHLREITKERQVADRALDNARREFDRTIEASEQASRTTLASSRSDLDQELAELRTIHQDALERQHREHEALLQKERERRADELRKASQRNEAQLADLRTQHARTLEQQKAGTRDTLAELRESVRTLTTELQQANEGEQRFRQELSMSQRNARTSEQRYGENLQAVRDELTLARNDLRSEQQRNAALRRDVVKRTAEAHQAVDRTLEERSSQLADLEAMVVKQREQAERRVRDAHAAADSRARASAKREAELTARVTRLERELDQTRPQTG